MIGCNDCMINYREGEKHYCDSRDLREVIQRCKSYARNMEKHITRLKAVLVEVVSSVNCDRRCEVGECEHGNLYDKAKQALDAGQEK